MSDSKKLIKGREEHLVATLEILKSGYLFQKEVQSVLKPFDISHEQYNVLRVLEHNHPKVFSLKEVQKRLMNQTANTTRLVEKLKTKEFICSDYCEHNRRMLEIKLTDKGQELLDRIRPELLTLNDRVKEVLTTEEALVLTKLLRQFRKFS